MLTDFTFSLVELILKSFSSYLISVYLEFSGVQRGLNLLNASVTLI